MPIAYGEKRMDQSVWALVFTAISYALMDSVDPCMYALYIAMLTPLAINIRRLVYTATVFIASVFVGYMLFNAMLRTLLVFTSPPRWVLSAVLAAYGIAIVVYTLLTNRGASDSNTSDVCREDRPLCKLMSVIRVRPETLGILGVAVFGIVASFTVLPCSAGMAVAFNAMLKDLDAVLWFLLITLYTFVFVLPLIALTLVFVGITGVGAVYRVLLEKQLWVKIAGGLVMIGVAMLIMLGII